MIQKNRKLLHLLNAIIDFIIAFVCYLLCEDVFAGILVKLRGPGTVLFLGTQGALFWPMLTAILIVFLLGLFGMYNSLRTRYVYLEYLFILQTNIIVVLVISVLFLFITGQGLSRGLLMFYFGVVTLLLSIKRYLMHVVLGYIRRTGRNLKHVIVLGSGALAQQYATSLERNSFFGFVIDGYFGDSTTRSFAKYLGSFDDCEKQLESTPADEIVIALDTGNSSRLKTLINLCETSGIKASVIPSFNNLIPSNPAITLIGGMKLIQLRCNRLDNFGYAFLKRTFDILISIFILILLSPLMLVIVICIKFSSPGPVLFKQVRVGKDRHEFVLLKFRSMFVNEGEETSWTMNNDIRKTRVGTFLRKFSLDELPQFWNVIRGDMSLIGPRPEIPHYVNKYRKSIPKYMVKHQIRPGMTGLAQINGYRGDTEIAQRIYYDIWYIENWMLWLDIKIFLRTIFGGFINKEKPAKKTGDKR